MTNPAVFIFAHRDDEILSASVSLAKHLAATPGQDIHVLWLTDSSQSGAKDILNGVVTSSYWNNIAHNPADEGYTFLTDADMSYARRAEGVNAMLTLASGLPGTLTLHDGTLIDGFATGLTNNDARDAAYNDILNVLNSVTALTGPVRLKGHSDVRNTHPDHLAIGRAIRKLVADDPTRFGDGGNGARYYVNPDHWTDTTPVTGLSNDTPTGDIAGRVKNAVKAYDAWSPSNNSFGIGRQSVGGQFDTLTANIKSVYHL